jgi:hypothetical protein
MFAFPARSAVTRPSSSTVAVWGFDEVQTTAESRRPGGPKTGVSCTCCPGASVTLDGVTSSELGAVSDDASPLHATTAASAPITKSRPEYTRRVERGERSDRITSSRMCV